MASNLLVPFLGSLVIKYGVEQYGVVYTAPESLENRYYYCFKELLENDLFNNSYTETDDVDEYGQNYYYLNDYGIEHIYDLDSLIDPLYFYFNENNAWQAVSEEMNNQLQNHITPNYENLKNDYKIFLQNHKNENFYEIAVATIINNQNILDISLKENQTFIINIASILFLSIFIIYLFSTIIINLTTSRIVYKNSKDIRTRLFDKVLSFTETDFEKFSKSSLITRSTNDIQNIQNASIFIIKNMLISPLFIVAAILASYITAPALVWLIYVTFGVIALFAIVLFAIVNKQFSYIQKIIDKLNTTIKDFLSGLFTIRAYDKEDQQIKKFNKFSIKLYNKMIFANSFLVSAVPILVFLLNVLCIFTVWIGKDFIVSGDLNIGSLMAFMFFSISAILSFVSISATFILLPRCIVSMNRVEEVLRHKNGVEFNVKNVNKLNKSTSCIEFKNVSFMYPGSDVEILHKVNFSIKNNSTNIIVGKTGCGKSTLIKLILRFYDTTNGQINIFGENIKNLSRDMLYDLYSYISQNVNVFSGSIKENVNISDLDKTDDEIIHSLENSRLSALLKQKNNNLNYIIAHDGINISGGQKQRLTISRAFLKNADIFIFDDPFSSVDFKTEKELLQTIKNKYKNKTLIYTTQRLQTIKDDDNIIFISEEGIVCTDTHLNLINSNNDYKLLFN